MIQSIGVFIGESLIQFRFHAKMVHLIMQCISCSHFSINVNGEPCGYFKGARGLRQGDPLSPYLFTLVMEVFTHTMKRQVKNNVCFKYHWGGKEMELTHLCFADDLLVVCKLEAESIKAIKAALDEFSSYSGLLPNEGKSTIFFGSVEQEEQDQIIEMEVTSEVSRSASNIQTARSKRLQRID